MHEGASFRRRRTAGGVQWFRWFRVMGPRFAAELKGACAEPIRGVGPVEHERVLDTGHSGDRLSGAPVSSMCYRFLWPCNHTVRARDCSIESRKSVSMGPVPEYCTAAICESLRRTHIQPSSVLIFLNQAKRVLSSQVIFNGKNKPIVSDHFGVEVALIL